MKRIARIAALLCVAALSAACSSGTRDADLSPYDRIQKTLRDMKNYEAEATVIYYSNKTANQYVTKQYAKTTGEYRIEVTGPEAVAGNVTIFDGKTISQFNKKIDSRIASSTTESPERAEILLTSFVHNYYAKTDEKAAIAVSREMPGEYVVLEAKIPGDHPYLTNEKLWLESETLRPLELVIYDGDGNERIVVAYGKLEYNVKMDDKLFTIDF